MKILASEDATALKPWTFPEVKSSHTLAIDDQQKHEAVALEQQRMQQLHEIELQEAIERGYQEGFARGQQAADAEMRAHYEPLWQQKLQLVEQLLQQLATPLSMIDDELEQIFTELVTKLTRHLVAHELSSQPEQILYLVKNAIELLPIANRSLRIYVNTEDKILLSQTLSADYIDYLTEDMNLQRGECRFSSDSCELDATLESRLSKLFAQVFHEGKS